MYNHVMNIDKLNEEMRPLWVMPDFDPYMNQVKAMNFIHEHKNFKYFFVEMPVGSGKSAMAMTISRYFGNYSYALTPQTILQKQYEKDFKSNKDLELASFYGKSNYRCIPKGGVSCAIGSILKPRCASCPYNAARDTAVASPNTVMNYKLALSAWKFTKMFNHDDGTPKMRDLMIMDEGHTLESHMVDFDSIVITDRWCEERLIPVPSKTDMHDVVDFIRKHYYPALVDAYDDLLTEIELMKGNPEDQAKEVKKVKELKYIESQLNATTTFQKQDIDDIIERYVLVDSDFGIEIRRLYATHSFKTLVEPMAKKFLFMSSTFLGKEAICAELGIDPEEAAYISLESEFDPEDRPVIYAPQIKMNYKWKDNPDRDAILKTVNQIAKTHDGENGIIHTGNFAIAEYLVNELNCPTHELIHHNPNSDLNRNQAIAEFIDDDSTPSILVSPSSTEGLDLKYDLARFAIFTKVPFGNIGDAWIKKRMQLSSEWYQRRALIDIIQGGGRIVRAPDDDGVTYILDASFAHLYNQNKHLMPQWWKDAYQVL